jgi:hypothetical protein
MLDTETMGDALTAAAFTRRCSSARDTCISTCTGTVRGVIRYFLLGCRLPAVSFRLNNIALLSAHLHHMRVLSHWMVALSNPKSKPRLSQDRASSPQLSTTVTVTVMDKNKTTTFVQCLICDNVHIHGSANKIRDPQLSSYNLNQAPLPDERKSSILFVSYYPMPRTSLTST